MLTTVRAVVRDGEIKLLEPVELSEGSQVLVTLLTEDERDFWLEASRVSLDAVWDNEADDVYAELLEVSC